MLISHINRLKDEKNKRRVRARIAAMAERRSSGNQIVVGQTSFDDFMKSNSTCVAMGGGCVKTDCPPDYMALPASPAAVGRGAYGGYARVGDYQAVWQSTNPDGLFYFQNTDPDEGTYSLTHWEGEGVVDVERGDPVMLPGNDPSIQPPIFTTVWQDPDCADSFRETYLAGTFESVGGGAAVTLKILPTVAMKAFKLYIPGGSNWQITSITVGLVEYLNGGSLDGAFVSGGMFGDMNMDSGRLTTDWISPSMGIVIKAINIMGGPLDFNPTIIGIVPN